MVSGNMNGRLLRTGLSVFAALLLSSAAFAEDAAGGGDDVVLHAVDPVVETGGDPVAGRDDAGDD